MFLLANVGSLHGVGGDVKGAAGAIRLCIQLGRGIFIIFRERHVKKCSRSHQEWSRGYKNSRKADVCCRFGPSSGRGPKSAIAEISTGGRARGAPEIGNCRNQYRGSREGCARNRQLPKLAPGVARRVHPKSAIAEISTGGRARGAPEIGNCRNQYKGHPSQSSDNKTYNHHPRFQGGLFVGCKVASFLLTKVSK